MPSETASKMLKSILLAFDGSEPSFRAYELSIEIAIRFNAKLLIMRAMPADEFEAVCDEEVDHICEEMRDLCRDAVRRGVRCRYRLDVGRCANQVSRAVEDSQIDIVIVGRKRYCDPASWEPDSELSIILSRLSCPVTFC